MNSKFSKIALVASAMSVAQAVTDHDNGNGGNAPCLETYALIAMNDDIGWDAHAVHGLLANDGGVVAVGNGLHTNENPEDGSKGFVVKTKGTSTCSYTTDFPSLAKDNSGCDAWDWTYSYGEKGKKA